MAEDDFEAPNAEAVGRLDVACPVLRFAGNPILTAHDVNVAWKDPGLAVTTVHNAGIAEYDGEVVMLFRSHLRSGVSVLGLARSADGLRGWRVADEPAMLPARVGDVFAGGVDRAKLVVHEMGGIEDPRITRIGQVYYITYSAYNAIVKDRVRVSLATTTDFETFTRYGPVLDRDMRNVVIFPEPICDRSVALFRPNDCNPAGLGGGFAEIRIGTTEKIESNDWTIADEPILRTGGGPSAFSDKIGPGAPPLRTPHGWLDIFHGVRATMAGNPYCLGVALHNLERPEVVQASAIPILVPSAADCRVEETDYVHVPNVVFTCGAIRRKHGMILLYYGGNDTVMNVALSHEDVLAELCRRFPMDSATGRPAYELGRKRAEPGH